MKRNCKFNDVIHEPNFPTVTKISLVEYSFYQVFLSQIFLSQISPTEFSLYQIFLFLHTNFSLSQISLNRFFPLPNLPIFLFTGFGSTKSSVKFSTRFSLNQFLLIKISLDQVFACQIFPVNFLLSALLRFTITTFC